MKEIKIDNEDELRPKMVQGWKFAKEMIKGGAFSILFVKPNKSRDQEAKYHAMIEDIRYQAYRGHDEDAFKATMVNQFAKELERQGEPLTHPGKTTWDWVNQELITVRPSTKKFSVKEACNFIEWLYALGTDLEIQWSEPAMKAWQEYKEAK